jgi:hypothetical protein
MDDRYTWREPQHRKTRELMALEHPQTMTVEEYFLLERNDPDACYEYVDGHIYAMAGGTFNDGINPEEDFSTREENETLPGQ